MLRVMLVILAFAAVLFIGVHVYQSIRCDTMEGYIITPDGNAPMFVDNGSWSEELKDMSFAELTATNQSFSELRLPSEQLSELEEGDQAEVSVSAEIASYPSQLEVCSIKVIKSAQE